MKKNLTFVLIILTFILIFSCKQQDPVVSDDNKAMLLKIEDFQMAGVFGNKEITGEPKYEKSRKVLKSWFLQYAFTYASEGEIPIVISERISFEDSANTAKRVYIGIEKNFLAKFVTSISTMVEYEAILDWGDETKFYTIFHDGNPVGNVIIVRIDKKVFQIYLSGFYFNSPSELESIIRPKLDLLTEYIY